MLSLFSFVTFSHGNVKGCINKSIQYYVYNTMLLDNRGDT